MQILRAGLLTGIVDGLFSTILVILFYHSTFARLWQGVASVLLGPDALKGGTRTTLIGIAMHFGVAFTWTLIFALVLLRLSFIQDVLRSPLGAIKLAIFYGPLIWIAMSCVAIPLLTHRPPVINSRWWIQLVGHIPFVAIPLIASLKRN